MSNYKEQNISGTKWQRCNKLIINNPYMGQQSATFLEEEVTQLDGYFINNKVQGINFDITDPNKIITLVNSATGVPTGSTITIFEIYEILHSLYLQLANERDNT